jgi:hypothetical protein
MTQDTIPEETRAVVPASWPGEFQPFPKIPRLNRQCVFTEKIDGTNASIWISPDGEVRAASRNRFITTEDDNYSFAAWVKAHDAELVAGLGPGTHFGEWWGCGINRGYGLFERRFALFNVDRWRDNAAAHGFGTNRPACCGVVPLLGYGNLSDAYNMVEALRASGSVAVPGFMRPEGVVVFHTASQRLFKVTLDGDEKPKTRGDGI